MDVSSPNLISQISIVPVLELAAQTTKFAYFYPPGQTTEPLRVSYSQLYLQAQENARRLTALPEWKQGGICLVRLDHHLSNVQWFWSIILAGGIPAMCPPFVPGDAQAKLKHLRKVLRDPLCLTTQARLQTDFGEHPELKLLVVEELLRYDVQQSSNSRAVKLNVPAFSTAVIMLTSGSSGNSKAVPISHSQICSTVRGKSWALPCSSMETILNWVSMDHVAGLIEGHIRALMASMDQVHVEAADITGNPVIFLELLDHHKVSSSFAPHFLLASLVNGVESGHLQLPSTLNLSYLRNIASGGEACTTSVCHRAASLLQQYGAPANVIMPAFGMTETCAGCIFNRNFPDLDLGEGYAVASVGRCAPGVEMRITSFEDAVSASTFQLQEPNVVGNVELRGPIVFNGYLNNTEANIAAFTTDNWFRTGDMGFIDQHGNLILTGRTKEVICINGVNHLAIDQERAIESANIPGVTPNYVVCFAWRPPGAVTEQCCIIYQHSYEVNDKKARLLAQTLISKAVLLNTGSRPFVLPLPPGILDTSSLGKLSRSKISAAFEHGKFATEYAHNTAMVDAIKSAEMAPPTNDAERRILNIVQSTVQLDPGELGIDTAFHDAGMTSVYFIRLKSQICREFGPDAINIKDVILLNTVRSLAKAVSGISSTAQSRGYEPVVKLKSTGSKTPLWLIHPGVGEVLVFVGLAQHIQDRPVYALRARGFEKGETVFRSIGETVSVYTEAIRTYQPQGPYAIAGYSYGSMLAFEVSKRLEGMGQPVKLLGCFNLPPHIKSRMRQLSKHHCLIHLALFLQLINDAQTSTLEAETASMSFESTVDLVLSRSDQHRWQELELTREGLLRWTHVAYSLQSMAKDYEPSSTVEHIDVFYCDPLAIAARSRAEWLEEHLSKWRDFSRSVPTFHPVNGAHYTMLSAAHAPSFHKTFEKVLSDRGL